MHIRTVEYMLYTRIISPYLFAQIAFSFKIYTFQNKKKYTSTTR